MIQIEKHNINRYNSPSFGWLAATHNHITKCTLKQFPELAPYKTYIKLGSVFPDFRLKQTSLLNNASHNFVGGKVLNFDIAPENASDFYFDILSQAMFFLNNKTPSTLG